MRNVSDKSCKENYNTYFVFDNFFYNRAVYEIILNSIVEMGRPQLTLRCMRISCRIPKATHTDSAVLQTARCLKTEVQKETRKMKESVAEKTKERWHGKRMHGQLPRNLHEKLLDIEQSYRWLKTSGVKGETESKIEAAQDQAISKNYFKKKILKEEIGSKCRLGKQHEETIDHLTSGCHILAKNEY